jgi:hypothetical protein
MLVELKRMVSAEGGLCFLGKSFLKQTLALRSSSSSLCTCKTKPISSVTQMVPGAISGSSLWSLAFLIQPSGRKTLFRHVAHLLGM